MTDGQVTSGCEFLINNCQADHNISIQLSVVLDLETEDKSQNLTLSLIFPDLAEFDMHTFHVSQTISDIQKLKTTRQQRNTAMHL